MHVYIEKGWSQDSAREIDVFGPSGQFTLLLRPDRDDPIFLQFKNGIGDSSAIFAPSGPKPCCGNDSMSLWHSEIIAGGTWLSPPAPVLGDGSISTRESG
jgi:hypothetical protein